METSFFWFGVFSSSFGVRSIVLCKCSGKYIDIYFKLKITFELVSLSQADYLTATIMERTEACPGVAHDYQNPQRRTQCVSALVLSRDKLWQSR